MKLEVEHESVGILYTLVGLREREGKIIPRDFLTSALLCELEKRPTIVQCQSKHMVLLFRHATSCTRRPVHVRKHFT